MSDMNHFRKQLDAIDQKIINLLSQRLNICDQVAVFKKNNEIPMMQASRVQKVKENCENLAQSHGISGKMVCDIYGLIIAEACRREDEIIDGHSQGNYSTNLDKIGQDEEPFQLSKIHEVLVIGGSGGMGSLFCSRLGPFLKNAYSLDIHPTHSEGVKHLRGDASDLSEEAIEVLGKVDMVLIALHEEEALKALPGILKHMAPGALLVDTLSIKSPYMDYINKNKNHVEILSLNPLFGPSLDFAGQKIAVLKVKEGKRSEEFLKLLESFHCHLVFTNAEEHDEVMAICQALVHALVLGFGMSIMESKQSFEKIMELTTLPGKALLSLLSRMTTLSPETYFEIQKYNPYAEAKRKKTAQTLESLGNLSANGGSDKFKAILSNAKVVMQKDRIQLNEYCKKIFQALNSPPA